MVAEHVCCAHYWAHTLEDNDLFPDFTAFERDPDVLEMHTICTQLRIGHAFLDSTHATHSVQSGCGSALYTHIDNI